MCSGSTFPNLPITKGRRTLPLRPPRVCIATGDIVGPIRNGGIGSAYFSLASALAEAAHEVTILYLLGDYCEVGAVGEWRAYYRDRGIKFVPLPSSGIKVQGPPSIVRAHDAYCWLKAQEFDVIHFPEWQGHGYFTALAKHQGLDFAHTVICVGTHSPHLWHRTINREFLDGPTDLETDFMERQSVALADVVVSPSQYMLEWMRSNGWKLPEKSYVQPNVLPPAVWADREEVKPTGGRRSVKELVFFGRLEERKGLVLFCDAVDALSRMACPPFEVTFLGKTGRVAGLDATDYIDQRAKKWTHPWQVLTDCDQTAALQYLRDGKRLAVIASLVDNLPNTVLESLHAGIPFLAARSGGIPEMIHKDDLAQVTFRLDAKELTHRLFEALRDGVPLVRPALDPEINRQCWIAWHNALFSARPGPSRPHHSSRSTEPLVSVCLTHRDRPGFLRQAVASLEAQDWRNFEVIVVDDGSTTAAAAAMLARLQDVFDRKGWQIIRQAQRYPGAARNTAQAHARGDYLLFMDDDNCAKPDEISTFVRVAEYTGADILTCFLDLFTGDDPPGAGTRSLGRWMFLGAALVPSIFRNYLGDTNFLIRKEVFRAVGGFTEDPGISNEDWEFLVKAVLMGFRLELVPRALVWYRIQENSFLRSTNEYENVMRCMRPYLEAVPAPLRDMVRLALGLNMQRERVSHFSNGHLSDAALLAMTEQRLTQAGHHRFASFMKAWMEYSQARQNMPPRRLERLPHIARLLMLGRYHRYGHGLGSAYRDLRKPPRPLPAQ
jgi:glycosyltransferase involved in cell wall biosynthesis